MGETDRADYLLGVVLSPQQRVALKMSLEGKTPEEIALETGRRLTAVHVSLRYAKNNLGMSNEQIERAYKEDKSFRDFLETGKKGRKGQKLRRPPWKYNYEIIQAIYENNPDLLYNHEEFAKVYQTLTDTPIAANALRNIFRKHPEVVNGNYNPGEARERQRRFKPEIVESLVIEKPKLAECVADLRRAYIRRAGQSISEPTVRAYVRNNRERWERERRERRKAEKGE